MMVPPFFAIVLLKTIWLGGTPSTDDNQGWLSKPQAYTTAVVEPTMKKCQSDGTKWETDMIKVLLSQKDPLDVQNGVWKCEVQATGGLLI